MHEYRHRIPVMHNGSLFLVGSDARCVESKDDICEKLEGFKRHLRDWALRASWGFVEKDIGRILVALTAQKDFVR